MKSLKYLVLATLTAIFFISIYVIHLEICRDASVCSFIAIVSGESIKPVQTPTPTEIPTIAPTATPTATPTIAPTSPPEPTATLQVERVKLDAFPIEASAPATIIEPQVEMPLSHEFDPSVMRVEWSMHVDTPQSPYRGSFGLKIECTDPHQWLTLFVGGDESEITLNYGNYEGDSNRSAIGTIGRESVQFALNFLEKTLTVAGTEHDLIAFNCEPVVQHVVTRLSCDLENPLVGRQVSVEGLIDDLAVWYKAQ